MNNSRYLFGRVYIKNTHCAIPWNKNADCIIILTNIIDLFTNNLAYHILQTEVIGKPIFYFSSLSAT